MSVRSHLRWAKKWTKHCSPRDHNEMEFLNSSKIENPRKPKNSGARKHHKQGPENHRSKRNSRYSKGATRSRTPATQPHEKPTATHRTRQAQEQQPQATQAQQNAATHRKKKQTTPTPRTSTARHARHNAHARPPPPPAHPPAPPRPLLARVHEKLFKPSVVEFIMLTALHRRASALCRACRAGALLRRYAPLWSWRPLWMMYTSAERW